MADINLVIEVQKMLFGFNGIKVYSRTVNHIAEQLISDGFELTPNLLYSKCMEKGHKALIRLDAVLTENANQQRRFR